MNKKYVLIGVAAITLSFTATAEAHHPKKKHHHPSIVPPVFAPDPGAIELDRVGRCDQFDTFWNLVDGQEIPGLILRPANVGLPGNENAIWC